MKRYFFVCLLVTGAGMAIGQKKMIDNAVFGQWLTIQRPEISANGKYVAYNIDIISSGKNTLVIQKTDGSWKKEISGATLNGFTHDSQWLLYNVSADSLCLFQLAEDRIEYYPYTEKFEISSYGKSQWIAILNGFNNDKELLVLDLTLGTKKVFPGVIDFAFSKNGESLVINRHQVIEWISPQNWKSTKVITIPKECEIENLIFDSKGKQIIFLMSKQNKNSHSEKSVWYFKLGMACALEKLISATRGLSKEVIVSNASFSADGSQIIFEVKEAAVKSKPIGVMVDVWSYIDKKLQAQQLNEVGAYVEYKGVFNIENETAFILQGANEQLWQYRGGTDNYVLLRTNLDCYSGEIYWRSSCRVPLYLVNTRDGSRRLIKENTAYIDLYGFSPDGKYILYYDRQMQAYFTYFIDGGKTFNITQHIPFPVCDKAHAGTGLAKPYNKSMVWLPAKKGIVIYDEYDLWLVEPMGKKAPLCLTNGYGRANGIMFHIIDQRSVLTEQKTTLAAFRPSDKANGFYSLSLTKTSTPELLTMGSYLYYWPDNDLPNIVPMKADKATTWIVERMTASEAPNLFVTNDFKSFKKISNLKQEKDFNWFTSELHEWTTSDGKKSQGILYKPENFDPNKKYPLIFHFYEEKSNELHKYILPEATGHAINIPQFVSNGYLVFVPDIFYDTGEPAKGVYNSVVSAANYISKMPFVDSTKIGMQGHSWGGYQVNVLVTKTGLFAAAAEAAGPTDFVSGYGSVLRHGNSNQFQYETGQCRIKATLWEKPDLYITNSPIFDANKVTTPLLIMHCKGDGAVPFEQGVEWFTALRRLNKPAWMLQYDGEGHQIGGKNAEDYTIRLKQFLDHYLKDAPAPIWQTRGIPAKLKGIESGYGYDLSGNCGKDCNVCIMWNKRWTADSTATKLLIEKEEKDQWMGLLDKVK